MSGIGQAFVAIILVGAFIWQVVIAARKSTLMSFALCGIALAFVTASVLNVESVENSLGRLTGVETMSSLLNAWVPSVLCLSCALLWWHWRMNLLLVAATVVGSLAYAVVGSIAWSSGAPQCQTARGYDFDWCQYQSLGPVLIEITGLIMMVAVAVISAFKLSPAAGLELREGRAAILLIAAVVVSSVWAIVAGLGVIQMHRSAGLDSTVFAVRTYLAAAAALTVAAAAVYVPAAKVATTAWFALRARHLLRILGVRGTTPVVKGGTPGYAVTDVMDSLGAYLTEVQVDIVPTEALGGERVAADLLRHGRHPGAVTVPVLADADTQRQWLLRVARLMTHDDPSTAPASESP